MQKFCRYTFFSGSFSFGLFASHFNPYSMLIKTFGSAVYGVEATTITVEVNWMATGTNYLIVGLPDSAVKETMQRVESAIKSIGYSMPRTRIVINLAPADIKKSGSAFDLPIAIGLLAASEQLKNIEPLKDYIIMGELSLDGALRSIKGCLPMAIKARKEGYKGIFVPSSNAKEAGMVNNLKVYGVNHVNEVIDFFENNETGLTPVEINAREEFLSSQNNFEFDFSEVKGQENIKRALE